MRSSRTGSWSPGVNEVEAFILASQNFVEVLIEIVIQLCVRTQAAHLLVLIATQQGTQSNEVVTATEENGNETTGGNHQPAQHLNGFQSFRKNPTGTHETQNDHRDSQYEEQCSQSGLQKQSDSDASNDCLQKLDFSGNFHYSCPTNGRKY